LDQAIDQINDNANVTFNGKTLVDGAMNKTIKTAATTVFTNQSLSTASFAASVLTDLKDRDGNSIDIKSSDTIKVSFVQNGKMVQHLMLYRTLRWLVSSRRLLQQFLQRATVSMGHCRRGGGVH
jgi:flagellin